MYYISVEESFDAAHFLREYGGKCERLHGHRFKLVVKLRSAKLNKTGMAYDFTELKKQVNEILGPYDHQCLNEVPPFNRINPSSENVAKTVFDRLSPLIDGDVELDSVEVWESPGSCATYKPD
ncbi:MAG: 6-carboxytetrahydropterin synthase QueD [Chloroflexi bacterium]|nr:6-carboxytetrahydropterin synthase QueD [Chloroflexota bacterium]